uniref:Minor capsid protein VP2 n=1 Tax=Sapovirus GXII/WD1237 TaxID=1861836 RepID=A0A192F0G3_9CALI|nr:minor capsid protein VP2 [Sapovirus GXII/WD1237]
MAQYALVATEGLSAGSGLAGTIGNIIIGTQQVKLGHRQLDFAKTYADQVLSLQQRQLDFEQKQAEHGLEWRHHQLQRMGYNNLDTRRLLGSGETVYYGGAYVPPMPHFSGFTTNGATHQKSAAPYIVGAGRPSPTKGKPNVQNPPYKKPVIPTNHRPQSTVL